MVGAVGVENNENGNFRDLREMRGHARNIRECREILIAPLKLPREFTTSWILSVNFPTRHFERDVGFGPKSCGTDGKPDLTLVG
jgi:hypothetical protein